MPNSFFCVDNGAYSIKSGYSTASECTLTPNCISKGKNDRNRYIGSDLSNCRDLSGMIQSRPFEKGYLTNWGLQKDIWDSCFPPDLSDVAVVMTEPIFNLPNIQQCANL